MFGKQKWASWDSLIRFSVSQKEAIYPQMRITICDSIQFIMHYILTSQRILKIIEDQHIIYFRYIYQAQNY